MEGWEGLIDVILLPTTTEGFTGNTVGDHPVPT